MKTCNDWECENCYPPGVEVSSHDLARLLLNTPEELLPYHVVSRVAKEVGLETMRNYARD